MLTNNTLEWIIVSLFIIIVLRSFYLSIKASVYNVYWHKQIAGDDFDHENDYDINQEKPFYLE